LREDGDVGAVVPDDLPRGDDEEERNRNGHAHYDNAEL
jgi:hypothetical protein